MKKKLFYGIILTIFVLNIFTLGISYGSASNIVMEWNPLWTPSHEPEVQISVDFVRFLHKLDYRNPREVFMGSQYISRWLYPEGLNFPDSVFDEAVNVLGECLEKTGNYTKGQIDKAAYHMLKYRKM